MARRARELSALEVGRLAAEGAHAVGVVSGLQLQIIGGSRAWILRTTIGDKRRRMGLGPYPQVSLADARAKARKALDLIEAGVDPILDRQRKDSELRAQQAAAMTFAEACRKFIDARGDEWRNAKHRAQWAATLEAYAEPILGKMLVADVEHSHVLRVLEPIWKTKTETASRVRGRIEQVLDWAKARGFRGGENPARWRGHLDKLLSKPSKIAKVEHHPALPVDGVAPFVVALRQREGMAARALEFLILTAARSGEVRGSTWSEMDLDAATWTIPAERMKGHREHRVPLSEAAMRILRALPHLEDSDIVFHAPRGGVLSDMALTAVMRRMEAPAVPHGFRSSFRDWAAERTNYPRDLAEMALAHTIESKVEAAYRRGDLLTKRAQMMGAWASFCGKQAGATGDVVALKRKAAA